MALDAPRAVRGAVAGTLAAAVWAAQQPLDQRLFGVDYDDCELLGRAFVRRSGRGPVGAWRPVGIALHLSNGALFGAAYALARPSIPLPSWARGPAAGLSEGVATWPMTMVTDRVHPARAAMPRLWGNPAAFGQMLWRHTLFGVVLGEIERRLNPPVEPEEPVTEVVVSSNGHGRVEDLAPTASGG